jgi:hypothetical protein
VGLKVESFVNNNLISKLFGAALTLPALGVFSELAPSSSLHARSPLSTGTLKGATEWRSASPQVVAQEIRESTRLYRGKYLVPMVGEPVESPHLAPFPEEALLTAINDLNDDLFTVRRTAVLEIVRMGEISGQTVIDAIDGALLAPTLSKEQRFQLTSAQLYLWKHFEQVRTDVGALVLAEAIANRLEQSQLAKVYGALQSGESPLEEIWSRSKSLQILEASVSEFQRKLAQENPPNITNALKLGLEAMNARFMSEREAIEATFRSEYLPRINAQLDSGETLILKQVEIQGMCLLFTLDTEGGNVRIGFNEEGTLWVEESGSLSEFLSKDPIFVRHGDTCTLLFEPDRIVDPTQKFSFRICTLPGHVPNLNLFTVPWNPALYSFIPPHYYGVVPLYGPLF